MFRWKAQVMILLAILFLAVVVALLSYQKHLAAKKPLPPRAVDGVMDLAGWDFTRQGTVMLQGEWEFYWERLLGPEDFTGPVKPRMTGYIKAPGLWNGYVLNQGGGSRTLGGDGYATYRAVIRTGPGNRVLGLKVLDFATSYRLWVNGELLSANGTVGRNKAEAAPQAFPRLVNFNNRGGENEIILQIANFSHSKGGMWTEMYLGTAGQVQDMRERQMAGSLFLGGALVIMAVYHFGLYLLRRKDRSTFFCALLCLLIAARAASTGEILLLKVFPGLSWSFLYFLQYISFYLAVPVLVQFIYLLYPLDCSRRFVAFAWGLGALFSLTVIVLPAGIYSKFILGYEIYTIICLLYLALLVLGRAASRKREGAPLFVLGALILVLAAINDTLVANDVLFGPYVIDFALVVFMVFQSFVLSFRFSRAFVTAEHLSEELQEALFRLEEYSQTLEQKVQERTRDLEQARQEADAASRAKSDFLAVMSHEIRTPMHSIMGMTELLQASSLQAEQREHTGAILDSAELMLSIINDILDFSRIEEGKLTLEKARFGLQSVEKSVSALVEPKARQKGLIYRAVIDSGIPGVLQGDPLRLQQILLNLLGNAVKFTERGEITLRVSPAGQDGDRVTVRFEVTDTGTGIPEKVGINLFQPFTQADPSTTRRYGGTGLGLSICKRLVELMNGEIGYKSEEGQGTTFWFTVPFTVGAAAEMAGESVSPALASGRFLPVWEESPGPILVAEDSAVNRLLILAQLKKLGLSADVAENGKEAVAAAARTSYALVLMDCRMPEMDGFAAARAIRELDARRGGHTPIIAVTAGVSAEEREMCLASGMDECLGKPLRLAELGKALIRWLPAPAMPPGGEMDAAAVTDTPQPIHTIGGREELLAFTGGDIGLLINLIEAFLRDMPEKLFLLKESLQKGDAAAACLQAHGMKSSGTIVGAVRFAQKCREMEELAAAGSLEEVKELFARIEEEYGRVEKDLTAFLAEGKG